MLLLAWFISWKVHRVREFFLRPPEFTPEQPPMTSTTVGVEFRGVPYLLFNKESLCRIATAVGKPISLAPERERKENFEVAKLTVQVNLLKELPKRIVSEFSNGREVEISVFYPWLPERCANCNAYGHDILHCSRKPSLLSSNMKTFPKQTV